MSTLKVNEIEDYSGNTVTIKDNTVIEGAGSATKNLTVSGTTALNGAVTCSGAISAASATVSGTATAATVVATSAMTTPAITATTSIASSGTLTATGNCTIGGTLTVGGLSITQYLKAFGQYAVSDPTTDVAGSLAPTNGDLNLANGTYDYDSGNNKATFSAVFATALPSGDYLVIPYIATDYAALFRTRVNNQTTSGFDVEIVYTAGTNPTNSQFFNLHLAVLAL